MGRLDDYNNEDYRADIISMVSELDSFELLESIYWFVMGSLKFVKGSPKPGTGDEEVSA